jgi:hypothetical protein
MTFETVIVRVRFVRRGLPVGLLSLFAGRLRALGSLVYYLCYHLIRYYAVPLIGIAVIVPALWAVFGFVLACAAGVDYAVRKPPLSFAAFTGIYLLEQVAYGAGVFWGCLSRKCFGSYRIHILNQAELPV